MKYDSVLDQQSISGKIVSLILCVWKPCYMKSGHIFTNLYNNTCISVPVVKSFAAISLRNVRSHKAGMFTKA